jgi:hypothetical protein
VTLKKGVIALKLICPAGGGDCTGRATITTADRKRRKLGGRRFAIDAGKRATVKVKLTRRGKKQAAKLKRIRVKAGRATATLKLKAKR